eukprot:234539-Prymnesium_polylepis.3
MPMPCRGRMFRSRSNVRSRHLECENLAASEPESDEDGGAPDSGNGVSAPAPAAQREADALTLLSPDSATSGMARVVSSDSLASEALDAQEPQSNQGASAIRSFSVIVSVRRIRCCSARSRWSPRSHAWRPRSASFRGWTSPRRVWRQPPVYSRRESFSWIGRSSSRSVLRRSLPFRWSEPSTRLASTRPAVDRSQR